MPTVLQVVLLFWSSTLLALGDFRLSTFSVVCVQHMQSDTHTKNNIMLVTTLEQAWLTWHCRDDDSLPTRISCMILGKLQVWKICLATVHEWSSVLLFSSFHTICIVVILHAESTATTTSLTSGDVPIYTCNGMEHSFNECQLLKPGSICPSVAAVNCTEGIAILIIMPWSVYYPKATNLCMRFIYANYASQALVT